MIVVCSVIRISQEKQIRRVEIDGNCIPLRGTISRTFSRFYH